MPYKGWKHSPESIAKIKAAWTPERHAAHLAQHRGVVRSPEAQARMSAARRAEIARKMRGRPEKWTP